MDIGRFLDGRVEIRGFLFRKFVLKKLSEKLMRRD